MSSTGRSPPSQSGSGWPAVAFLLGTAAGRKALALGIATGLGVGGYVLYTLSNTTGSLEPLTWISPWRWYVADAMLINGLTWNVALPFVLATLSLLVGWWVPPTRSPNRLTRAPGVPRRGRAG